MIFISHRLVCRLIGGGGGVFVELSSRSLCYQLKPLPQGLAQDVWHHLDVSQHYVEVEGKGLQVRFQDNRLVEREQGLAS